MSFRILVSGETGAFTAEPGETLLDAADRAGVELLRDCRTGGCGTCRIRLLQGSVSYEEMPFALTEEEAAEGFALACQARAECDLVIESARSGPDLPPSTRQEATVLGIAPLADGVTALRLGLPDPLAYLPGQYANILLPDGTTRSFSMATAPGGDLEFHIRGTGGLFTAGILPGLRKGDRLALDLPLGGFVHRAADFRPLLFLATGTGIAPVRAILESLLDDGDCPPVTIYWGGRTLDDLYLHEEIAGWADRLTDFRFVPVLSRAGAEWGGARGHVQDACLAEMLDVPECAAYLCGSPAMVRDARAALLRQGANPAFLYVEGFTTAVSGALAN